MKKCSVCNKKKSIDSFYIRARSRDGRQSWCKACSTQNRKLHYKKNHTRERQARKNLRLKYVKENVTNSFKFLSGRGCMDCGEKDPIVLEYDHKRDKKFNVSERMHKSPWYILVEEIKKCDVRCANCHRRKTAKNWYKYLVP